MDEEESMTASVIAGAVTEGADSTPPHGLVRVDFGRPRRVLSIDDRLLRAFGAADEDIASRRGELLAAASISFSENPAFRACGCPCRSEGKRRACPEKNSCLIRCFDGAYRRGTFWRSCGGDGDSGVCSIFLVLDPEWVVGARGARGIVEDALDFGCAAADIVFRISMDTGGMVCLKNSLGDDFDIKVGLTMHAPDVLESWISEFVPEHQREDLADICRFPVEPIVTGSAMRTMRFDVVKGTTSVHLGAFYLNDCGEAALLLKCLDGASVGANSSIIPPSGVYIRTFGDFEVFKDGEPVLFRSEKAKEYLALLVDRRGAFVSSREAVSALWEGRAADEAGLAAARKAAHMMNGTLKKHGIGSIVDNDGSARRLDMGKVRCDLFDFLACAPGERPEFRGSYMGDYSWAEPTVAELTFMAFDDL